MHAAVVSVPGQPPRYQTFPDPEPKEGEVLIHVCAAGLHPIVKALASGSHYLSTGELPIVPGVDGVGTLDDGTRVYFGFARKPWGTMCERTVAPRDKCIAIPDGLDDAVAAAIPNPGMSGWLSLKQRAGLVAGETVLICGATGVAGRLAVQAARHLGAKRVIGAGRNVEALHAAGVDSMVRLDLSDDAIRQAFATEVEQGIDVVIDYLWGRPTELLLEAIAKGFRSGQARITRLIEVGESAGKSITLPGATLRSVDLRLLGSGFGSVSLQGVFDATPSLFSLAAAGTLTIDVDRTPLSDVERSWSLPSDGRRIVFTI